MQSVQVQNFQEKEDYMNNINDREQYCWEHVNFNNKTNEFSDNQREQQGGDLGRETLR